MDFQEVKDVGEVVIVAGTAGGVLWKLLSVFGRRRDSKCRAIAREEVELLRDDMDKQFDLVRADLSDVPRKTLDLLMTAQGIKIPITKDPEAE